MGTEATLKREGGDQAVVARHLARVDLLQQHQRVVQLAAWRAEVQVQVQAGAGAAAGAAAGAGGADGEWVVSPEASLAGCLPP